MSLLNSKTVKNDYFLKPSQLFQIFSDFKSDYTIVFLRIGAVCVLLTISVYL
jgi:hypothetical protein